MLFRVQKAPNEHLHKIFLDNPFCFPSIRDPGRHGFWIRIFQSYVDSGSLLNKWAPWVPTARWGQGSMIYSQSVKTLGMVDLGPTWSQRESLG